MQLSIAPLRGVTDRVFRDAFLRRFSGIDYAVAPFIPTVAGTTLPPKIFKDIAPRIMPADETPAGVPRENVPTIPQIIGKDPAQLRVMAAALRDLGFARMNLNCGCPWKLVSKKGRGCGLPEDENNFARMLEAGCESMPGGFSIKIRLGMKEKTTLLKRAALIASFPLQEIIIHPRTGAQMYEGEADIGAFAEIYPLMRCPVVYNGDIKTRDDYERLTSRFPGLSGVMLGRGLIADPYLASDIKTGRKTPYNPRAVSEFVNEIFTLAPNLGRMKELWGFVHEYFENGAELLRSIRLAQTPEEYESVIKRHLPLAS